MKLISIHLFIIIVCLLVTTVISTKDLILGRTYVVPAETPEETFDLLRSGDEGTNCLQILYAIFTVIQTIIDAILSLICSLIPPIAATVDVLRSAILVNLISIIDVIIPVVSVAAPQVGVVLEVVQLLLNASNELLYNGTNIIEDYGCSSILTINDVVSSIVNAILGVF